MGDWDAFFDENYLRTYLPSLDEERTRGEALGAVALRGVAPGAEILAARPGSRATRSCSRRPATASPGSTARRRCSRKPSDDAETRTGRSSSAVTTASCRSRRKLRRGAQPVHLAGHARAPRGHRGSSRVPAGAAARRRAHPGDGPPRRDRPLLAGEPAPRLEPTPGRRAVPAGDRDRLGRRNELGPPSRGDSRASGSSVGSSIASTR